MELLKREIIYLTIYAAKYDIDFKNRINFVELCRILWKSTKTCEEIWVVCKLKSNI